MVMVNRAMQNQLIKKEVVKVNQNQKKKKHPQK
jgi:hypothetical protein